METVADKISNLGCESCSEVLTHEIIGNRLRREKNRTGYER